MNEDSNELPIRPNRRRRSQRDFGFRLRTIFVPYVVMATGFLLLYTSLHWLMIVGTDAPPLDEVLVNFVLPMVLPWLPILGWFRHRVRLLVWRSDRDAFPGYVVAWLGLAIPTLIAQAYLETAAGNLTQVDRVSQINTRPGSRYYLIRDFAASKAEARRWVRTSTSGRHSQHWNIDVHYAIPLRDPDDPGRDPGTPVWLGVRYRQQLASALTAEERQVRLDGFLHQAAQMLGGDDLRRVSYFMAIGRNEQRRALEAAINGEAGTKAEVPAVLLSAQAGSFAARNGNTVAWLLGSHAAGLVVWFLLALLLRIDPRVRRRWKPDEPVNNSDLRAVWEMFVPRAKFFATPSLLDANLLVWIAMVLGGVGVDGISGADLLHWGGLLPSRVYDGEIWRLFTSLFVHAGLMHLANNMVALGLLGFLVERAFGSRWFLGVYLAAGLAGGLASMLWLPAVISVGASGSIFGVAGFGLVLLLVKKKRFAAERPVLLAIATAYLGINLLIGAFLPGINLLAHVVGLVTGAVVGLVASPDIADQPVDE